MHAHSLKKFVENVSHIYYTKMEKKFPAQLTKQGQNIAENIYVVHDCNLCRKVKSFSLECNDTYTSWFVKYQVHINTHMIDDLHSKYDDKCIIALRACTLKIC